MSNQTNELKNMMASFFQMNTASTSGTGSLPSNTVANPKEEDERVKETLTDPEHGGFTIKLPEKLGDPGKFLIPCGFSELKCKALADLGIARDVFVPVGKFTFPAENEEIVFNPGIITSKRVHSSLLPELSHRAKVYKSLEIHESPMEIFSCS
ncbi:hypothetical protein Tco_1304565 [Tanacetum coccineum]